MGTELRFRDERGVDADAFDWLTPAEELGVPIDDARALYEEALRRAMYPGSRPAKDLYLEWLAAWEPDEPLADPGRHTLTMRIGQGRRRAPARRSRTPGKQPLTAHLAAPAPRSPAPAQTEAQTQPDDALAAAWRQPGRHLRLVEPEARPSGDELARGYDFFLQRGRSGAPLPSDVATRLGPHVGHDAVRAARLHTDDTADRVAAAHRARAVAVGDEIYFARGEYAPGTERGDELLAHELTHVAQAQRGDLFRAAAKGIDSGTTLDPAEAEAELRAKLAVLQLHAPAGAAPELAAPSGQPTSDSERAARLAAQQQRLELADQDAPADAAVPEPPATTPEAPVEHPAPEMTDATAAAAAPSSKDSAYVTTFDAAPSKQATELWAKAGAEATTQTTADDAAFEAGLEPLPVELDGDEAPAAPGGGAEHTPGQPPAAGAPPPAATPTPTPAPPPTTAAATAAEAISPTAAIEQLMAAIRGMFAALPTTLPADVPTEPGPAPVTDLAGQADPARAVGDHQHAMTEGADALEAERAKILQGPGAAQVQPALLDEKLPVPAVAADGALPELPTVEGMAKFKKWALPAEAQASFDEIAKPKLETNLAQAKAQMKEAEVQRDADRAKAVDDAHEKVKQAHVDADKQQQAKVAETRSQIANHQAQTLLKQEKEVKKLEQQSGEKKKGTIGKIQDRLTTDQAKVETNYADAKTKAADEKTKGEAEVARKKEDAEKKANEDKSWWDQLADAICDAVKAIADEIDKALDAVAQAIGQILDAVKTAACQLIDAARDFVCQALTEFGDWLKSAVTALLGSVFPELAAELNRLIDEAVNAAKTAVNAVADSLKTAVTALCDGLKAGIEAAIAAFKAAVQAAVTFVQALVTGDWSLVAKMVLDGILQALGIDPAAFYALVGKAQDSLEKIVADPGAFVGHLIDAVKLGFSQFGTNFWTHLQSGVVQWLFGTFSDAGIRMPARFDIAGIFDLVTQVLGLTWDRLRVKVVGLIGEENTERLEFVSGYLNALVQGGFAGLWEKVQQDLSNLWDMVIGGVKDWLIQNVVQQAILKIATMWNPAGAIFQLIQTAWNAYQWLRQNAQRIFGLAQAVVDSIAAITAGNITGAANWIEQSLAKLVPVAISLFADLIGLGGLADEIRTIIQNVQKAVDDAIDALIERVKALFKGKEDDEGDGEGDGEQEVPKSLAENQPADLENPSEQLSTELSTATTDQVIYQAGETDPEQVTENLLAEHPDASFDKASGRLTLPPISEGALAGAASLADLGQRLAEQTGVSKVTLDEEEGGVALRGHINPTAILTKAVSSLDDNAALALYRGLHFGLDWDPVKYDEELEKDLIGKPQFADAAYDILGIERGSESSGQIPDLEAAARTVRERLLDKLDTDSVKQWWSNKQQEFSSVFFALLQRYINQYGKFKEELEKADQGAYSGLEFVKIPFISTSKMAIHAARYARGGKLNEELAKRIKRTDGVIGRVFVYVFTVGDLKSQGAVDVKAARGPKPGDGVIKVRGYVFREGEVTFTGMIPGQNVVGQMDAKRGESEETVADRAEDIAQSSEAAQGGLHEWEAE
jgi:hypothetical protein